VNAPGQEEGAAPLPEGYEYPTMEQLAEQVQEVLNHFSLVRYIGIGIGLGANVLVRHALQYPERVDSLMVANACSGKAGWVEWGYQVLIGVIYSRTFCLYSGVGGYNWILILRLGPQGLFCILFIFIVFRSEMYPTCEQLAFLRYD